MPRVRYVELRLLHWMIAPMQSTGQVVTDQSPTPTPVTRAGTSPSSYPSDLQGCGGCGGYDLAKATVPDRLHRPERIRWCVRAEVKEAREEPVLHRCLRTRLRVAILAAQRSAQAHRSHTETGCRRTAKLAVPHDCRWAVQARSQQNQVSSTRGTRTRRRAEASEGRQELHLEPTWRSPKQSQPLRQT